MEDIAYIISADFNGKVFYNSVNLFLTENKLLATRYYGEKPVITNLDWISEEYKNIKYESLY